MEAALTFIDLPKLMRTGNHQREVSEGLSRSYLKSGDFKMALEAANQLVCILSISGILKKNVLLTILCILRN